jgi:hypothetical protein
MFADELGEPDDRDCFFPVGSDQPFALTRIKPNRPAVLGEIAEPSDEERKEQLDAARAELSKLELGALQKRATSQGVHADKMAKVLDAGVADPKELLITLLLELIEKPKVKLNADLWFEVLHLELPTPLNQRTGCSASCEMFTWNLGDPRQDSVGLLARS